MMMFNTFMLDHISVHYIREYRTHIPSPLATQRVSDFACWPFIAAALCVAGLIASITWSDRRETLFCLIVGLLVVECAILFYSMTAYVIPFYDLVLIDRG